MNWNQRLIADLEELYERHVEARHESALEHPWTSTAGAELYDFGAFRICGYCWCEGTRHPDGCPANFEHPASGLTATWYKHLGRGFETSRRLGVRELVEVRRDCEDAVLVLPRGRRIMITGSREWVSPAHRAAMVNALRAARARAGGSHLTIVHGAARGADTMAGELAVAAAGAHEERWPAIWRPEHRGATYDRATALSRAGARSGEVDKGAGFARNTAMLHSGIDEVIAFFAVGASNRGTAHAAGLAEKLGIPLTRVEA